MPFRTTVVVLLAVIALSVASLAAERYADRGERHSVSASPALDAADREEARRLIRDPVDRAEIEQAIRDARGGR